MRKIWGHYREYACPFCGRQALVKNSQGVPVCREHLRKTIEKTCACGRRLELRNGKWGPFFLCQSCGPMSFRKGMSLA